MTSLSRKKKKSIRRPRCSGARSEVQYMYIVKGDGGWQNDDLAGPWLAGARLPWSYEHTRAGARCDMPGTFTPPPRRDPLFFPDSARQD